MMPVRPPPPPPRPPPLPPQWFPPYGVVWLWVASPLPVGGVGLFGVVALFPPCDVV